MRKKGSFQLRNSLLRHRECPWTLLPASSSHCSLWALTRRSCAHCRRAAGFASSGIGVSLAWPDKSDTCLLVFMGDDLDRPAQSALPTCYEWTCKRSNSAFAFLFEAFRSYKIGQCEVYVDLCFTLSNMMWRSVKSSITLSGHVYKNSQTKSLMAEALVNI